MVDAARKHINIHFDANLFFQNERNRYRFHN